MSYAIIIGGVVFMLFFYVTYFRKVKAAGGSKEAGKLYWREQFALESDEDVVSMGVGTWYIGPLVPESMRSTGERVFDALTLTTYRGANMWLAFTSKNRLAIAVEETADGPRSTRGSLGLKSGYAPLAVYGSPSSLQLLTATEIWPGSDKLPKESQKPRRVNLDGQKTMQDLVQLSDRSGEPMTFFVETGWIDHIRTWCAGGPALTNPRYVQ